MNKKINISLLLIALVSVVNSAVVVAETEIQKAFLKEYAFLQTQKRELVKQISEFEKKSKRERVLEEQQVTSLEKDLYYSELELEKLQQESTLLEHSLSESESGKALLDSTIEQSMASFKDLGINAAHIGAEEKADKKLYFAYSLATTLINTRSEVSKVSAEYFNAEGKKVFGDVLKLGAIAAFAIDGQNASVLMPAGAGRYKVSSKTESVSLNEIIKNTDSATFFVYEDANKAFDTKTEKTLIAVINSGGVVGWVIVMLGLIAVALVVMRVKFLRKASESINEVQSQTVEHLSHGNIEAAKKSCESSSGATARVVAATLRNIDRDREHIEDVVSESILHESAYLNRFSAFITVIAAVSPLLGLLGTVTGMISTFDVITEFGTGDPKLLSGGISTALVTTELGLVVAIPALIVGNLLSSWSNRIKDELEKAALKVITTYNDSTVFALKAA